MMILYFVLIKQLKKMRFAVELAGGVPILMDRGNINANITKPGTSNLLVIFLN